MQRLLIYIKQKCSECFRDAPIHNREDQGETISKAKLIQMKQIQTVEPINPTYSKNNKNVLSKELTLQNIASLTATKNTKISKHELYPSKSKISQEQFFSIEEFVSQESGQASRRSFKIGTLSKINTQSPYSLFKSQSSIDNNLVITDYSGSEQCKLISQTQKLLKWIRLQYQMQESPNRFQVRHAIRLKISGNSMTSLLIHKLEDFKVSYLAQSKMSNFNFQNKSKTISGNFQMNLVGSSIRRLYNVSSYYRIECSTINIGELLRLFKCKQMLRILHSFTNVSLTNIQSDFSGLDLPIFTVKHQPRRHKKSRKLHIGWQIGQVQFEDEQGKQIFEVGFSLDEGDENWQRIIKYSISNKGYIEIYFQCHEQASLNERQFFSSRFLAVELFLLKKKIIDK